ncbi:MAG TPA: substrate-binding domain-containing protein [Anaeromyxobacter sp.]|nr:substrate-binding domain-containing protein [Anaeromyxobacter sp.]
MPGAPSPSVAVLLRCERQEFQRAQAAAAVEAGAREGMGVEVAFADNSPITQIQQVLSCANRAAELRPRAIVIELVGAPEGYRTAARAALSAGLAWVEVSGLAPSVPLLRAEFPRAFVMSVTSNEEEIGRLHAAQCRALLPAGGDLLYVEGPSLQPEVKARRRGLEEGLRGSQIAIARTLAGAWTGASAEKAMTALLERPSGQRLAPALVCAQNDEMAVAARRIAAARHPEWARLPYLGCDGLPDGGVRYVKDGLLAATVVKPVTTGIAVTQAALAIRAAAPPRDVLLAPRSEPALDVLARAARAPAAVS